MFVAAVDVGSTSARAAIVDGRGHILGRSSCPILVNRPVTDHAEHSSDDIWAAVCGAVRAARIAAGVPAATVRGIGFDATCSLVLLDTAGHPTTVSTTGEDRWNVVMWADHRAIAEADEITAGRHRVLDSVGGVMSPEMQMPKLLWLKRQLPASWQRYCRAFDLADFLVWRACGKAAASACTVTCKWGYLNHEAGWQTDFLAAIGLADLNQRAGLSERARPLGSAAGRLTVAAAADLDLTTECTVAVGIIDAHAGGLGVLGGIDADGLNHSIAVVSGTSTCHMAVSRAPRAIPGVWGPYFGAMFPALWLNEGGQSATGALLDHVLDWHAAGPKLGPERHDTVAARVETLRAAHGPGLRQQLLVLPDFHGNRSPLADPEARGVVMGLTLDSGFDSLVELYYAAAVGIALGTRHILDAFNGAGYAIERLHLTGGHAASPLLVRLYADVTGCTVVLPAEPDGVLIGTAALGAAAASIHPDLAAAAAAMARPGREIAPDPSVGEFFDRRYQAFLAMHEHRRAIDRILHHAV